jgi:hypothetical protein
MRDAAIKDTGAHVELTLDGDELHGLWDWMHGNGPRTPAVDLFKDYVQGLMQGRHSAVTIGLGATPDGPA